MPHSPRVDGHIGVALILLRRSSMRFACLLGLVLSPALATCAGDPAPGPDTTADGVTITITSDQVPELVVFRDGISGAWQAATMKTATTFEAVVHGPYTVTVVCKDPASGGVATWQDARTPDDGLELSRPCYLVQPTRHVVNGHMVQAGYVQIGSAPTRSTVADWNFSMSVASGTYDLIATTDDRIAIRRGVVVNGDTAVTPPVDVVQEGSELVDVAFTATNPEDGEDLSVSVGLLNATTPAIPARIYLGPIAAAKAAPDSALAPTDTQSASVRATRSTVTPAVTTLRALRRPFRVGGNAVFAFPKAFTDVVWSEDRGRLSVSWTRMPDFELFAISAYGTPTSGTAPAHTLEVSQRFLETLDHPQVTLDTDIPGYLQAWKVGLAGRHVRSLFAQKGAELGVLATTQVSEQVN